MRYRWAALLLVVYVGADFANPLMPGAVTFDADGSVEAHRLERAHADVSVLPPSPEPLRPAPRPVSAAAPGRMRRAVERDVPPRAPAPRLARSATSVPGPSPEDH